jgi:hypothetical protein
MRSTCFLLLAGLASPLSAQTAPAIRDAAMTITADDVKHRIEVIADDSMGGRDTPSPGLDKTAQYVANEFQRFGLRPGGENGTWFQRYRIIRSQIEPSESHVGFMLEGKHFRVSLDRDARFWFGDVPENEPHGQALLLGGPITDADVASLKVQGKAILLVADMAGQSNRAMFGAINQMRERGAVGVMVISSRDSAAFARSVASQARVRMDIPGLTASGGAPVIEVHERALTTVLSKAGIDAAAVRTAASPVIREIPGLTLGFGLRSNLIDSTSAPNTIGIIEGSDPRLREEYVIFTAHMDHVGNASSGSCRARGADSICNGADDDASGTVGVVELAEAFSRSGARPKRSVIFMTVSGEEKGLRGSAYYAAHPTVPLGQIVADINLDMIGRNWPDTIVAIGREHSDLGETLARVQAAHPELNMAASDDRWPEEGFYARSDHFNFARKGVPILFFFNGVHEDYHQVSDSPEKIDADKESRILKLLFYLGEEIANSAERPKWNPASYDKYVEKGAN